MEIKYLESTILNFNTSRTTENIGIGQKKLLVARN